jgi:hypothetical protein
VLLVATIVGVGAYPVFVAMADSWNPLGTAACAAGLCATLLWTMHAQNKIALLLAAVQFLSLTSGEGLGFWVQMDNAERFAPAHVAILAAGWLALGAWLRRLPNLREEDPDYVIPIHVQHGPATRVERAQVARASARFFPGGQMNLAWSDRWHDRLANVRAATPTARQRLLRYGFAAVPMSIMAIVMALTFFVTFYAISQWSSLGGRRGRSIDGSLAMMMLMPAIMSSGTFAMRRPRLAQELCLPLTRKQLFNGLFAVAGTTSLIAGATSLLAAIGLYAVTNGERLMPRFVVGLIALSVGAQLYAFGVTTWAARKGTGGVRNLAMVLPLLPVFSLVPIAIEWLPHPAPPPNPEIAALQGILAVDGQEPAARARLESRVAELERDHASKIRPDRSGRTFAVSVGLGVVGLLIIWDSRRRWLRLELG